MRARAIPIACGVVLALSVLAGLPADAGAQSARTRYESAQSREPEVRRMIDAAGPEAPAKTRALVQQRAKRLAASYDAIVRRFPTSGYSDNALAQAGSIHEALYARYGRDEDKTAALGYYRRLISEYPTSSLIKKTRATVATLSATRAAKAATPAPARAPAPAPRTARAAPAPAPKPAVTATPTPTPAAPVTPPPAPAPSDKTAAAASGTATPAPAPSSPAAPTPEPAQVPAHFSPSTPASLGRATLTSVQRTVLPEAVRVTLVFDHEVRYHEEHIAGPPRVFFDLPDTSTTPALVDAVFDYPSDVVRQIRLGRHPNDMVRVVLDLEGVTRHSVFTLYNPYRIVIDCERNTALRTASATPPASPPPVIRTAVADEAPVRVVREADLPPAEPDAGVEDDNPLASPPVVPARETAPTPAPPPAPPSANAAGGFSIARQLGLGVSRIVIDPGHGGRDPGVQGRGLSEAPLTLDVALRLEKLLLKEPGVEVVLTRRSDVYVPLEERTAIANRENADLFLSIHANASRNADASGIETYFLSFASSPEAEAVAARENSASERAMHNLPDIIKAIALNNKLDESRELAGMVQDSLLRRVKSSNKGVRDRGVKKAPFVVLIGAQMPSVLAEISFLSNRQENQLLRNAAYKDRIAEALHQAVMRYRQALKGQGKVAEQEEQE